jgi:hypothetical protein
MRNYPENEPTVKFKTTLRDHAEAVLHHDFEAGLYCTGDVEIWPAELWPEWTTNWHWEPTEADAAWAEAELNQAARNFDLVDEPKLEWPGTREEWERWLDALAPTDGELEHTPDATRSSATMIDPPPGPRTARLPPRERSTSDARVWDAHSGA